MKMLRREAQFAGRFYPDNPNEIGKLFSRLYEREKEKINYKLAKQKIIGAVIPHAGFIYSGYQAVHFFEILTTSEEVFDTFIILHPFHRGGIINYASDTFAEWETPMGQVKLDEDFINYMNINRSESLYKGEHSAEVILPYLMKYVTYPFKIVPIGIARQNPDVSLEIAVKLREASGETGRKICLLASSDFSHYLKPEEGFKLDSKVLDKIVSLDPVGVFNEILANNISVCGYGPLMTLMYFACSNYSSVKADILARGHSGEVQPSDTVVDYISILFSTITDKP